MEIRMALDGKARHKRTIKLQRHTLKVTSLLLSIITLSRWTYKHVLREITRYRKVVFVKKKI